MTTPDVVRLAQLGEPAVIAALIDQYRDAAPNLVSYAERIAGIVEPVGVGFEPMLILAIIQIAIAIYRCWKENKEGEPWEPGPLQRRLAMMAARRAIGDREFWQSKGKRITKAMLDNPPAGRPVFEACAKEVDSIGGTDL
jgi:hypothetical protein